MFSLISVWSICLGHEKAAIGALKRPATRKRLFLCLQVEEKGGENATWPYSTVKFLTRRAGVSAPRRLLLPPNLRNTLQNKKCVD